MSHPLILERHYGEGQRKNTPKDIAKEEKNLYKHKKVSVMGMIVKWMDMVKIVRMRKYIEIQRKIDQKVNLQSGTKLMQNIGDGVTGLIPKAPQNQIVTQKRRRVKNIESEANEK